MANVAMMGWDADAKVWRKLVCNAAGKLIIDPSEIFEDPPTDGEAGKAPSSNWAFDHNANASAHHTKYIDSEARAAIGGLLDATGRQLKNLDCNYKELVNIKALAMRGSAVSSSYIYIDCEPDSPNLYLVCPKIGGGYDPAGIYLHNGTNYEKVAVEPVVDSKILTHKNISNAHHTRYTNDEAIAAVGYNGTRYWSCPGIHFEGIFPYSDLITKSNGGILIANANSIYLVAPVLLPHGAVVTNVIVNGNDGASSVTWMFERMKISDKNYNQMTAANINTGSSSIAYGTIDNSLYSYFFHTASLDVNDELWGAVITYTI